MAQRPAALVRQEREQAARETPQLAALLAIKPGMIVADVGAGGGAMSVAMAKWLGPEGRVYAMDIGAAQLAEIKGAAAEEGVSNVVVLEGAAASTNLPNDCCHGIFLRDVYHHLTKPNEFDDSLLAGLKPGGRLAIMDQAIFVRAMGMNTERPDGAVRALGERLSELFGEHASVDDSTLTAVCEAFLKPIFDVARLDPDALPLLETLRQARGIGSTEQARAMNIGVLASHEGTTLQSLLDACSNGRIEGRVAVVVSNNGDSGALRRARQAGVEAVHLSSRTHEDATALDAAIRGVLVAADVDVVFLAGYMKKLGPLVLEAFAGRILNTHPALLPRFGGPGMYGDRVFEAVLQAGEAESGVSIHLVDADYDTGAIVRQCRVPVLRSDSLDALKARVRAREKEFVVDTLGQIAKGDIRLATLRNPQITL